MDDKEIAFWTAFCRDIADTLCAQFRQDVAVNWIFDFDHPDEVLLNLFCGTLAVEDDRLGAVTVFRQYAGEFLPILKPQITTFFGRALLHFQRQGAVQRRSA